jgi:glutamate racemase
VIGQAAPLLVPLVEEGWLEGDVPRLAVRRYVEPLLARGARAIVLGCTHYPLLYDTITAEAAALSGAPVPVVDSAHATAEDVAAFLRDRDLASSRSAGGALELLVTDLPASFATVASRFLGHEVEDVALVDL